MTPFPGGGESGRLRCGSDPEGIPGWRAALRRITSAERGSPARGVSAERGAPGEPVVPADGGVPGAPGAPADREGAAAPGAPADPNIAGELRAPADRGVKGELGVPADGEVSVGRGVFAGVLRGGAAEAGRDRGTTVAAGPSPGRVPGGEPPADDAGPATPGPGPGGRGRGATSFRAAPAIEPPKFTSGMRRTATGFPVIPVVVAPGPRPRRDGTDPAARRRDRDGISVTGQVAGARLVPPSGPRATDPASAARAAPPEGPRAAAHPEAAAPQDSSVPWLDGYHHSGGRTCRSVRAGAIGTGPARWRRIRGAWPRPAVNRRAAPPMLPRAAGRRRVRGPGNAQREASDRANTEGAVVAGRSPSGTAAPAASAARASVGSSPGPPFIGPAPSYGIRGGRSPAPRSAGPRWWC